MFCSFLVVIAGAHADRAQGGEVDTDPERLESLDAIEDTKNLFRGLQQELHENDRAYGADHQKATFIITPTFDDIWLIAVENRGPIKIQDSETFIVKLPEITEVRVSILSRSSINDGKLVEPWHDVVRHTQITEDYYSKQISLIEFDEAFNLISDSVNGETIIADQDHGCTDGTTFFVEVFSADERSLISRHNCDDDYESVLRKLHPFFEVAWAKIPYVQAELRDIWISETRETNTLK